MRRPPPACGALLASVAAVAVLSSLVMAKPASATPTTPTTGAAQWALERLDVAQVWQYSRGEHAVVALLDTGVDALDPELAGRVLPGVDLAGGGAANADGRVDLDPRRHGTRIARLVAGDPRGAADVQGLAPRAEILPVVVTHGGPADPAAVANGIGFAVERHARVILVPLAVAAPAQPVAQVLAESVRAAAKHGAVVVAAAGDQGARGNPPLAPAAVPGVLGVSAVDRADRAEATSERGGQVLLAAPDSDATGAGGQPNDTGSAQAAAATAAAVALVLARYPTLSGIQAANRLLSVADDRGPPGRDNTYGYGVLNVIKALTLDVPTGQPDAPLGPVAATPVGPATPSHRDLLALRSAPPEQATAATGEGLTPLIGASIAAVVLLAAAVAVGVFTIRRRPTAKSPPS